MFFLPHHLPDNLIILHLGPIVSYIEVFFVLESVPDLLAAVLWSCLVVLLCPVPQSAQDTRGDLLYFSLQTSKASVKGSLRIFFGCSLPLTHVYVSNLCFNGRPPGQSIFLPWHVVRNFGS